MKKNKLMILVAIVLSLIGCVRETTLSQHSSQSITIEDKEQKAILTKEEKSDFLLQLKHLLIGV